MIDLLKRMGILKLIPVLCVLLFSVNAYANPTPIGAFGGTITHTQPSVTTATSFTCLAANTGRHYFMVQNNTAANIMINLAGGTLTGIVPTSSNLGIVLVPGANYESNPAYASIGTITCYQTSGGTVNTISVMEGSF